MCSGKKLSVKQLTTKDEKGPPGPITSTSGEDVENLPTSRGKSKNKSPSKSKHQKKHKKHKSKRSKHKEKKSKSKCRDHHSSSNGSSGSKRASEGCTTDMKKQKISNDEKPAIHAEVTGKQEKVKHKKLTSPISKAKNPPKYGRSHVYNATVVKSVKSLIVKNVECSAVNQVTISSSITTPSTTNIPTVKQEPIDATENSTTPTVSRPILVKREQSKIPIRTSVDRSLVSMVVKNAVLASKSTSSHCSVRKKCVSGSSATVNSHSAVKPVSVYTGKTIGTIIPIKSIVPVPSVMKSSTIKEKSVSQQLNNGNINTSTCKSADAMDDKSAMNAITTNVRKIVPPGVKVEKKFSCEICEHRTF